MERHSYFNVNKIDNKIPKLSIVIPCYNEAKNIPVLFDKLKTIQDPDIEIILVNNGSTDNTKNILMEFSLEKKQLFKTANIEKNIGYGHGIIEGIKNSTGDVIAWTHADMQTDPYDVVNAYSVFTENSDYKNCILKGKRVGRNLFDAFFTFGMGLLSSFLMRVKLSDINAQPKMFHHSFLEKINNAPNDFSLDLYLLYQAKVNGYKIIQYPVHFGKRLHGEAKGGGSLKGKWKLIKRTWAYMKELKDKLGN